MTLGAPRARVPVVVMVCFMLLAWLPIISNNAAAGERELAAAAAAEFERAKHSPVELRMFLQRFPKGGDLHSHLSGAVYAEDFIDWAVADGLCFSVEAMAVSEPPCEPDAGRPALATALAEGQVERDAIIDAWSMRNFVAGMSAASGHDQFFATFSRFDAGPTRGDDMLAAAVATAADQNVDYLELMTSPQMGRARRLADEIAASGTLEDQYEALIAAGIEDLVAFASAEISAAVNGSRRHFGCPESDHRACRVEVRFLAQVIRTFAPHQVFAQSLLAFLLVESDPRVVGLNLVAPEDDHVALATYGEQMRQLGWLAERRGPVPVTLHAGELTLGLVPPRHLRDHMRQAIEVAGARRIGHGVDIAYERDAEHLLMDMARDGILVEVNLTSNATILGVEGDRHPFETYRKYGVPVALSTDDEGVSRIDLTHEYQRAVATYGLDYGDVKGLARNALTYAFVPGDSLWADPAAARAVDPCADAGLGGAEPPAGCSAFLEASEKARLQWRLEAAFRDFEAEREALRRAREF